MNKPNIVIDVDGVIFNFGSPFSQWWNEKYSEKHMVTLDSNPDNWDFNFPHIKKYIDEYINTCPSFPLLFESKPKFIEKLKDKYTIHIVTAYHQQENRIENLAKHDIKYDNIIFTDNDNKVKIIHEIKPEFILEDSPHHITNLSNLDYKIYTPSMWNYSKHVHNLPGVTSYEDLEDLEKKLNL